MRDALDQAGVLLDCKGIAIDFESQDIVKPPRGSVGAYGLSQAVPPSTAMVAPVT
jgi:hypothetical protein